MTWELLAALVTPYWVGDRIVGAALGRPRGLAAWLRHAGLALQLGLAVVAALRWVLAMTFGSGIELGLVAEVGLIAASTMLGQRRGAPGPKLPWAPVALLLLIPAAAIAWQLSLNPWGDADALSIWNLRAVFLHRAPGDWVSTLDADWPQSDRMPHVDYPLLLPLLVARGYAYAGTETESASAVLALLFGLAPIATLCGALTMQRGSAVGLAAGGVLVLTPIYLLVAAERIADVPLAGYVLATVVLMAERRHGALLLAGIAAGAASFTKNEGIVWALFVAGLYGLLVLARRRAVSELLLLLLGIGVVGFATLWFKLGYAPAQDLLAAQAGSAASNRLADPSRWVQVAEYFARELCWFGGKYPGVPGLAVLVLVVALLRGRNAPTVPWTGIALLHAMVGVYFAAFLLTPYDVEWHLKTAAARLLLHVWPAALFLAGLSSPQREHKGVRPQADDPGRISGRA